ncbi:MAG: hypothetical protein HQK58_06940, partial [Deltaproteobacteria bacterium]|nr:hypothetical protein [Deltaproteobacteria bacterium]
MVKWFKFRKDKTSERAVEPEIDESSDKEPGDLPVAEPPADSESDDITGRDDQTARQADPPEEGPG